MLERGRKLSTLTCTMDQLCFEYTFRYGKVHETYRKLCVILSDVPKNIPKTKFTEPPQCMPEDVKSESVIDAYHKYYAVYKKVLQMDW